MSSAIWRRTSSTTCGFTHSRTSCGLADGFPVRQRDFHSQLLLNEIQPFAMSGSGNELILLHDARIHHAGNQRFTELSRSDYGYLGLGKHAAPFPFGRIIVS